ncbi:MAG: hypothetical protein JJD98_03045, partial [Polaromonas sp.]|nr:hypothetical protein [Polaromonas sp.]
MSKPILNTPTADQQKLEMLRQHFPQAVEVDAQGHIRINAAALQLAIDPSNPAGIQVEEDGYEMRWVGKREAYHSAFLPVQKILANWDVIAPLSEKTKAMYKKTDEHVNALGPYATWPLDTTSMDER